MEEIVKIISKQKQLALVGALLMGACSVSFCSQVGLGGGVNCVVQYLQNNKNEPPRKWMNGEMVVIVNGKQIPAEQWDAEPFPKSKKIIEKRCNMPMESWSAKFCISFFEGLTEAEFKTLEDEGILGVKFSVRDVDGKQCLRRGGVTVYTPGQSFKSESKKENKLKQFFSAISSLLCSSDKSIEVKK